MRNRDVERQAIFLTERLVETAISISLLDGEARQEQWDKSVKMTKELCDLLSQVLSGQDEHLEPLLRQLVMQKLPDPRIMESFGNFQSDLFTILKEGIELRTQQKAENQSVIHEPELHDLPPTEASPKDAGTKEPLPDTIITRETIPVQPYRSSPSEMASSFASETRPEAEQPPTPTTTSWPKEGSALIQYLQERFSGENIANWVPYHGCWLNIFLPSQGIGIITAANPAWRKKIRLSYYARQEGVRLIWLKQGTEQENLVYLKGILSP